MEVGVAVVAVADEAVAAAVAGTAIDDGPAGVQVVHQHLLPLQVAVARHIVALQRVVIAEVVEEGTFGCVPACHASDGGGAAARGTIVHLDSHSAVVHQGGHGVDFSRRAGRGEMDRHVGPVVGRGAEVGTLRAIVIVGVAVAAGALHGPVPVLHQLGHGGGHAARHRTFVGSAVVGAQVVVAGRLVPACRHQGSHHAMGRHLAVAVQQATPLGVARQAPLAAPDYLTLVFPQPAVHMGRDALHTEVVLVRVGQDGTGAVVARHQHKPLAAACPLDAEDIEGGEGCLRRDVGHAVYLLGLVVKTVDAHIAVGHLASLGGIHWSGLHSDDSQKQKGNENTEFLHVTMGFIVLFHYYNMYVSI